MMATQARQFAIVLERIGHGVLAQLQSLPDTRLNQQLSLPETNSLFALATHLVGMSEFWVLALVGRQQLHRDRSAEFQATGTAGELIQRYTQWLKDMHEVLDALPDPMMEQLVDPPLEYRDTGGLADGPVTVQDCLLHTVEHSALHLGHIQLTRQLLLSESE
ncbi:MAG: DinB family protein [Chloroflexi bacterium]|nr:DinB family protein [Chloroflexota bacterium]